MKIINDYPTIFIPSTTGKARLSCSEENLPWYFGSYCGIICEQQWALSDTVRLVSVRKFIWHNIPDDSDFISIYCHISSSTFGRARTVSTVLLLVYGWHIGTTSDWATDFSGNMTWTQVNLQLVYIWKIYLGQFGQLQVLVRYCSCRHLYK